MLIDHPDATIEDLMGAIKGPDFPTGAQILGVSGIRQAYTTGRGVVKVRAKAHVEPMPKNKNRIVVTEIPYQVNKARLIESIAHLVQDKTLEGITDLRDESDRKGMRIVIELRSDIIPEIMLNKLYKHTQMQESFGIIQLALVKGHPRILNLKEILVYYLEHQKKSLPARRGMNSIKPRKGPISWPDSRLPSIILMRLLRPSAAVQRPRLPGLP